MAAVAAVAVAVTLAIASPTKAEAWTWSSHVTVWGYASCNVPHAIDTPAKDTWVYVLSTGEIREQVVTSQEFWAANLTTIPSGGSWIEIWNYCAVPGYPAGWRFSEWAWIARPELGQWVGPYDQSA